MLRRFGRSRRKRASGSQSGAGNPSSSGDFDGEDVIARAADVLGISADGFDESRRPKKSVWSSICTRKPRPSHEESTSGSPSAVAILEPSKTPNKSQKKKPKRTAPRFSLRRLVYGTPLVAQPLYHSPSGTPAPSTSKTVKKSSRSTEVHDAGDAQSFDAKSVVWRDNMSSCSSLQGATALSLGGGSGGTRECQLCLYECSLDLFPLLMNCSHLFCINCLQTYVRIEIQEGRVNLKCPQCSEAMHPNGNKPFSSFSKVYFKN